MGVVGQRLFSTQQVFDSLVVLFRDARTYDAKPLNAAYAAAVMRLGIKLATERRLAQETLALPPRSKKPGDTGDSA